MYFGRPVPPSNPDLILLGAPGSFFGAKAGFRLRREENVYLDVVKIIEAVKG